MSMLTNAMMTTVIRAVTSHGQVLTRLFAEEVLGVPVRPIFIALATAPLLVLAVRGFRAPQRSREIR